MPGNNPVRKPTNRECLERYRKHLLDREYMSGIERNQARIKATAEVFTPDSMVMEMVHKVGMKTIRNPKKRIIDPACGDGQFLAYILYCRLEAKVPLLDALKTLYGIEHEPDNVTMCRNRLLCGHDEDSEVGRVVYRNIAEADTLTYHMRFDGTRGQKKPEQMRLDLPRK